MRTCAPPPLENYWRSVSLVSRKRLRVQAQHLHGLFAHLHLADLAGYCHRELVGDVHVARDLVMGELAGGELTDLPRVQRLRAGAHPDPGHQLLAVFGIRNADYLRVHDVGMRVEEFLDLTRV